MKRSRVLGNRSSRLLLLCALLLSLAPFALATTFVVTKTTDTNDGVCDADCSLREAIIAANANPGADFIQVPAGTYTLTIPGAGEDAGATGDLDITDAVTISGAGASTTIIDGGGLDRVFHILTSSLVGMTGITIRGGVTAAGDNGAGILNEGLVSLNGCTVTANATTSGGNGGGIYNDGTLSLVNSVVTGNSTAGGGNGAGIYDNGNGSTITSDTISGNSAPGGNGGGLYINGINETVSASTFSGNSATGGDGGGIYNNGNGIAMTNCTISGNSSTDGGGFFNNGVTITFITLTIASNTATNVGGGIENIGEAPSLNGTIVANNTGGNCDGTVTDSGTNLQFPGATCGASITSADPLLGALADNGGPTQTMALGVGSPAIDANTESCPPPGVDQRGIARPQGVACDIGAFELQPGGGPTPTPTVTVPGPTATPTPLPGPPTATPTPRPGGQPVTIPTLQWPALAILGMLLVAAAAFFLRGRP